jgi:hypothetical protein
MMMDGELPSLIIINLIAPMVQGVVMFEQIKSLLVAGIAKGLKTSSIRMFNAGRDRNGNTYNDAVTKPEQLKSDARFTVRAVASDPLAVSTAREIAQIVCAARGFEVAESTKDGAVWFNSTNDTTAKLLA